jgi:hypothetical protein
VRIVCGHDCAVHCTGWRQFWHRSFGPPGVMMSQFEQTQMPPGEQKPARGVKQERGA